MKLVKGLKIKRQRPTKKDKTVGVTKAKSLGLVGTRNVFRVKTPPASWRADYPLIKELRKRRDAPVDSVGCERLADPKASKKKYEWQCLVAAMLSSQTKDQQNADAMENLRVYGNTVESIANISVAKLDRLIGMVGFHTVKAKNIKATAKICLAEHGGRIPSTLEGLLDLPGVGPKMAYLVLHAAFDAQEGICVDTHIHRIANLLGWISTRTPEETRMALEAWLPKKDWPHINILMVGLGQQQQQQSQLLIERCLASSSPLKTLRLISKIGLPLRQGKIPSLDKAAKRSAAIRKLLE